MMTAKVSLRSEAVRCAIQHRYLGRPMDCAILAAARRLHHKGFPGGLVAAIDRLEAAIPDAQAWVARVAG